ncbi:PQQ-binding-like beta-propeller repeat protein [Maioricimonas sp. JC845]|uniref:PQQ-binding-like beta-propeller repeat protein n=1 Tax=Maioricimonas sp. JC845 TaxID=3232138 RepID=UPI0034576044
MPVNRDSCCRTDHLRVAAVALLVILTASVRQGPAQDRIGSARIAVVDAPADLARRLATADELAARGSWPACMDELQRLAIDGRGAMYELSPGYYVSVARAVQSRLVTLPPEGLAAWRERVDPPAAAMLEQARAEASPELLEQIVDRYFASTASGEALWLLGEHAWRNGDLQQARADWTRLLPLPPTAGADTPRPGIVRLTDPRYPEAEILARLVLCSLVEGDPARAARERRIFAERFPEATGHLAGRVGRLTEILDVVAAEAADWPPRTQGVSGDTFAGNGQRNGRAGGVVIPGSPAWSLEIPIPRWDERGDRRAPFTQPPTMFPVTQEGLVALNTGQHILTIDEATGQPYWPVLGEAEDAIIFPPMAGSAERPVDRPVFGQAAVTSTIDGEGRLFALMGLPILAPATIAFRQDDPRLICLDMRDGEGLLLWARRCSEFADLDGWYFTGTPVVVNDRLYVACRHSRPELECGLVCLDAASGEQIWFTRVCGLLREPLTAAHLLGHELLTIAGGQVFYTLAEGPVAALDADTGQMQWFLGQTGSGETVSVAEAHWRPPADWAAGTLFVVDAAQTEVTAIHAASGTVLWSAPLDGRVSHIPGVANGLVTVAGSQLWALDAQTGEIVWQAGSDDPTGHGYGRGTIAGPDIIWPTREALWFIDVQTGVPTQRIPLAERFDLSGGNVSVTPTHLLLTTRERVVAFARLDAQEK